MMHGPHRFQYEDREQRGCHIHYHGDCEDGVPIARHCRQHIAPGHEKRRGSLGGVKQARIGRGVPGSVGIGAGGWKEAVDFPQAKKTKPLSKTNVRGLSPNMLSNQMPNASRLKAMNIVFSRPSLSETQPKNGRVTPLRIRSSDNAKVSAGSVMPTRLTGTVSTLKSLAIGASCAVAIKPPAPTSTNMTYMIQRSESEPSRSACIVVRWVGPGGSRHWLRRHEGARKNQEIAQMTRPCRRPTAETPPRSHRQQSCPG